MSMTFDVSVTVLDKDSNPVSGASVSIFEPGATSATYTDTTDANGEFNEQVVAPDGTAVTGWKAVVSKATYNTASIGMFGVTVGSTRSEMAVVILLKSTESLLTGPTPPANPQGTLSAMSDVSTTVLTIGGNTYSPAPGSPVSIGVDPTKTYTIKVTGLPNGQMGFKYNADGSMGSSLRLCNPPGFGGE